MPIFSFLPSQKLIMQELDSVILTSPDQRPTPNPTNKLSCLSSLSCVEY
ncbi:MAG UNVERIFIED_CONTAM: hypothetical protein LVR29_23805 [Microcystis novacekii LVE1205-3]